MLRLNFPLSATVLSAIALTTLGALSGCSDLGKSYRQIDPAGALADIRKHNGYDSAKSVTPGTAKLIVRGNGPRDVAFSTSSTENACDSFKPLATVHDAGRGVVYPWIADLSPGKGFAAIDLTPGQSVVVRADSSWTGYIATGNMSSTSPGHCGPHYAKFTPLANRAYIVEANWAGNDCSQQILDATNPDAPLPVTAETFPSCAKR